jgi:ribonuclease HII
MSRSMSRTKASSPGFRIGVDENGLGPRLGPMIITAVMARVTPEGARVVDRKPRGALKNRLGDSKELVSHGDVALAEAWARALVARGCGGSSEAASPDDLVHSIALDDRAALRSPCPSHIEAQCWGATLESLEAEEKLVRTISGDLDRLASRGVEVVAVRSVIACPRRMNDALDVGHNRFHVDLHAMERLVLALRDFAGTDIRAVCGKVGGFGRYPDAFGPLAGRLFVTLEEKRARSAYHFPGLGEIAFVRDADASDLLVSLASMVGKYLREVLMARVVRYYREELPHLPDASGYYDPVTTSFIDDTRETRRLRMVPSSCFERRSLESMKQASAVAEPAKPRRRSARAPAP